MSDRLRRTRQGEPPQRLSGREYMTREGNANRMMRAYPLSTVKPQSTSANEGIC